MSLNPVDAKDGTAALPPSRAVLAVLPFLLFGLAVIADHFMTLNFAPGRASLGVLLVTDPFLVFNWLILLGLAAGVFVGFPRWTFSYFGWALLNTVLWANLSYFGQPANLNWLPFAGAVIVPLLARRSLRPARDFLSSLRRDLTLPALGVYIFFTSAYTIFDENHHPALLFFMTACSLSAILGAWGYFRSASPLRRTLALIGGLAAVVLLNIWNNLTWDAAAYYGLPPSTTERGILVAVILLAVLVAMMLGLGFLTKFINQRKAA